MSQPKYGIYHQTATLPQGGEITVTLTNVNLIDLDPDQREWMFALIDLFHQYGDEPDEPPDA